MEYYFSDINLATTDHLMRFINKDPEGYGKIYLFHYFYCIVYVLVALTWYFANRVLYVAMNVVQ